MHRLLTLCLCLFLFSAGPLLANNPGGTNGSTTPVTLVNNGNGTVTMANGVVSILCTTGSATINQINYTYKNSATTTTTQVLSGGDDGGQLYWEYGGFGGETAVYTPVADIGTYAEIDCLSSSTNAGTVDIHFSMLQGSPGFYVTAIWSHRNIDAAQATGETRDNIYGGSIFNWMCVDNMRNRLMEVSGGNAVAVYGAPKEVSLWTSGLYQGRYEDKYKYSADFGEQHVWGWASVNASTGSGGHNIGLWNILGSIEYYNGGPMKRELMSHIGTTILNMTRGGHYGGGSDTSFAAGELWTHCFGPWFIYCNSVTNTLAAPQAAAALWADAQAQAVAEQSAWPYRWLTNAAYAPATNRGAVSGQIIINDSYNTNASASNLYVGVVIQPPTSSGVYDFQDWSKPYQFWVKSGSNGFFTISNVIAGSNYTLYAFGPGTPGMFMSQHQTGGNPDLIYNLPATPFGVTVTGGATNNLGAVTWTPTRVGPTVFEIGYPNRTSAHKYRHSDDWWVADIGPNANVPSPIWSKFLEYPFDFPSGVKYTVGSSRWTTDWNYVQPAVASVSGNSSTSTSTITFNLASVPAGGAQGAVYLATSSDFSGPVVVSINGSNLGSTSGTTSTPNGNGSGGYNPAFSGGNDESDSTVREGIHGCFGDERITFPASLLKAGANTMTIEMNSGSGDNHAMYDYIRLELAGYVPPPPASVAAWPGNNCNLLSWPLTPGATSYNILRSTTSGGGYASLASNVIGPVCGSGSNNATYLDTNALNGTAYYYVVQSVNPIGASANSPQSTATTPSTSQPAAAPSAPTGLVATVGHHNVVLTWNSSSGVNYYNVWRSILVNTGGGSTNIINTNILSNVATTASFTDSTVTDGTYYSYFVTAANAGGTSPNSAVVNATALPPQPASAPTGLALDSVNVTTTNQQPTLSWDPVPGAVGYVLYRSTSPNGPFTFGNGYVMALSSDKYTDAVALGSTYYYAVVAMNAGGVSPDSGIVSTGAITNSPTNATSTTLALTAGVSPCAYGASLTFQATVSPAPPNGETVNFYSGSAGIGSATTTGGLATLTLNNLFYSASAQTITATYLGDSVNLPSTSTGLAQTVTQGTLTYVANPASRAGGSLNPTFSGTVTGLMGGDTLAGATTGTLVFSTTAGTASAAGSYPINGSGLTASNYVLVQAAGNGAALTITNLFVNGVDTWSGGAADNNWMTAGNWTAASFNKPPVSGDELIFAGATQLAGSNNFPPTTSFAGLTFNPGGGPFLLGGNAITLTGGVTNNAAGAQTIDFPIALGAGQNIGFMNVIGGGSVTINGAISGAGVVLDFVGAGTLSLSGANTYSGGTVINSGGLVFSGAGQLGGGAYAGDITNFGVLTWNSSAAQVLSGVISGTGALNQSGPGTLTLSGVDTYTGATAVNAGTLALSAAASVAGSTNIAIAAGGTFNVSVLTGFAVGAAQTLSGAGAVSGSVAVNGTLSPGSSGFGALTFSNALTLAAGSTNIFKISSSPLTNDAVTVLGALTNGGTLVVTNVATTALSENQSFQLFTAAGRHGFFPRVVLPPLPVGLGWNTNEINTASLLSIVVTNQPSIQPPGFSADGLVIAGGQGVANAAYYLLTSTNPATPLTEWTPVTTNYFDAAGNFNFTNPPDPAQPAQFFILEVP